MYRGSRVAGGGGYPVGGMYGSSTLYGTKPTKSKEDRTISVTFGRGDGDRHCAGIQALEFHNGALYSASRDGTVKRWGIKEDQTPVLEGNYEGHSDWVNAIAFVDNCLASGSCDGTVRLWSPARKESITTITSHQDYVSCLASAPRQKHLASAGLRAEIYLHYLEVRSCDVTFVYFLRFYDATFHTATCLWFYVSELCLFVMM